MTAPLSSEAYQHIRADVHTAVLEAQREDPTVTLEILFRLLDELGIVATGGVSEVNRPGANPNGWVLDWEDSRASDWAKDLLREVQLRATSKVPYGEPREPAYMDVLDEDERRGY